MNDQLLGQKQRQLVIVTGMSGAGKQSVMRSLEDLGFYSVDNLPIPLMSNFIELLETKHPDTATIALGIDARDQSFLADFFGALGHVKKRWPSIEVRIIFLTAGNNTLLKRFQETRRKHPLVDGITIEEALDLETEMLLPIKTNADIILDTDRLTVTELRQWVLQAFGGPEKRQLTIQLMSFGFKYGVPAESNFVFDLRFLPNPYFVPDLRPLDGRSQQIQTYLFTKADVDAYWHRVADFLKASLEKSYEEGRFFVTVAIGCTGGRHRSVAFVDRIAKEQWPHISWVVKHRDMERST